MELRQFPVCSGCDRVLTSRLDGIIVQGNVYTATAAADECMVGGDDQPELLSDVEKLVFCKKCFMETVGWLNVVGA